MADDNKPQGNEGGDNGQQTEPAKEVVSYAKYKRETDEYQEQVKALKAELEQRDKQIEEFTSKAGNAEELQAALDKAKADNEAYKADAEKREADMRRDFAIDTKLAQMGVRNAKAARAIMAACEVDAAYGCSGGIMEGGGFTVGSFSWNPGTEGASTYRSDMEAAVRRELLGTPLLYAGIGGTR